LNKILLIAAVIIGAIILIPIISVIALVVVGLLLQTSSSGSGIPETTSHVAWKSAEPFAIIDYSRTGDNLMVVLKNNSYENLNLNSITIGGQTNLIPEIGIAPGATKTKTISGLGACSLGTKYAIPKSTIQINYDAPTDKDKIQYGASDLVGTCN